MKTKYLSTTKHLFLFFLLPLLSLDIMAQNENMIKTDKAFYAPGEKVQFSIVDGSVPSGTKIRYRQGSKIVKEEDYKDKEWSWQPPTEDYMGYMVELYTQSKGVETMVSTIAVDVSSDPSRFPRNGFVADFNDRYADEANNIDRDRKYREIGEEMAYLNRCHINYVQFQDWHWKHHYPAKVETDGTASVYWLDIFRRNTVRDVIRKYIEVQHSYGMKSIFYNLCFGAWKDAANDGVKPEWALMIDSAGVFIQDKHALQYGQSDIFLENPGNAEWQNYLADRNQQVYDNYDFDGYQIDQLGSRAYRSSDGKVYDTHHTEVSLPEGYASFLHTMKNRHPQKRLIMNAVSGYGAKEMCETHTTDFCYNEVWGANNDYGGTSEAGFANLYDIIKNNDNFSGHTLRTVFAAYMNYGKAGNADKTDKMMNTPGVLLTDAVMFALGGSHLELGDHMLSREYFPSKTLAMSDELKRAMIRYYDFMTAYQNLLRGKSSQNAFTAAVSTSSDRNICAWPPQKNSIVTFAKNVGDKEVVHLLNFQGTEDLSWRDFDGTRKEPTLTQNLPLSISTDRKVTKVWVASPDYNYGALKEIDFQQNGKTVTFTVPELKYWTMIVMEGQRDDVCVVGEATEYGWNFGAQYLHKKSNGSIYQGTVHLEAGKASNGEQKNFKFVSGTDYGTCVHYNAEYVNYNFNDKYNIHSANLVLDGTDDFKFTVDETGDYDITLDLDAMRIYVNKTAGKASIEVGSTGITTYCDLRNLDFSQVDGLKAYIATGAVATSNDRLTLVLRRVTNVPAQTGIMLYGAPGTYEVPYGGNGSHSTNLFKGVTVPFHLLSTSDGHKNFLLANGNKGLGFYSTKEGNLAAYKAYLALPESMSAQAKVVSFDLDDLTSLTPIIYKPSESGESYYYTFAGQCITNPSPGLYIHNGKKIILK